MKKITLWVALLVLIILAACSASAPVPYTDISPQELNSMLEQKDFLLVNTHIPFEGNIPETDLSIPYNEIQQNLAQLPSDKDAKIVLYCRSDSMSRAAAEELSQLGYTNLYNLDGGFIAWQQAGYPLQTVP